MIEVQTRTHHITSHAASARSYWSVVQSTLLLFASLHDSSIAYEYVLLHGYCLLTGCCQLLCLYFRCVVIVCVASCQVAVASDWQRSAAEQSSRLQRWQASVDRRDPHSCICAACIDGAGTTGEEAESDVYADVVGGLPSIPACGAHSAVTTAPLVFCWPVCPLCDQPMLFLVKFNTAASCQSREAEEAEESSEVAVEAEMSRMLLFFCCSDEQCDDKARASDSVQPDGQTQQQSRRWRVWRLTDRTLHSETNMQPNQPQNHQQQAGRADNASRHSSAASRQVESSTAATDDDWGSGGGWDEAADDTANDEQLTARIEQLLLDRQQQQHVQHSVRRAQATQVSETGTAPPVAATSLVPSQPTDDSTAVRASSNQPTSAALSSPSSSSPVIPSRFPLRCARPFYLGWAASVSIASSAASGQRASDDTVKRLLRQYQLQSQSQSRTEQRADSSGGGGSSAEVDSSFDDLADEYERSADSLFARFRRQLSRQPQQLIRYRTNTDTLQQHGSESESDSDSDSDSDRGGEGGSGDECLAVDACMKRGIAAMSHSVCSLCGVHRSFECQLLGSLVTDLTDVSTRHSIPLGWTTAALFTCRNAQCGVGQWVDETTGLIIAT